MVIYPDNEVTGCSKNAVFLVTVAVEMFVKYLAQQSLKMTYADRKQSKTMQYKDLASAVSLIDNFEFPSDVIPSTVLYEQIHDRKLKARESNGESGEMAAQRNGKRR
ncbi:hypothetical protein RUND412_002397 [Rhizina undulata]